MNTSFYRRYDGFKYIVEILEKQQGWEERAMSYFNQNMNVNSFRTWFLDMAKQRIKELWRRMGKVASLYFDNVEKSNQDS
jgi:exonuclease VII small subunit